MTTLAEATIRLRADTSGFRRDAERQLGDAGRRAGKGFSSGMTGVLGGVASKVFAPLAAAAAGVGLVAFFKGAVEGASDTQESLSKVGVVFGKSAASVKAFALTAATSLGLSNQAALEAAGSLGNLFVALKLPQGQAASMSQKMVTLAGDLASFNNVPVEDALAALKSGLVGETEPLRAFGVHMNEATLKAEAMKLGLIRSVKDGMTPAVKAQAAYALILDQTKTAQGDFARTSRGAANQQRIIAAQYADLKAKIGTQLLPTMVKLAGFVSGTLIPALGMMGAALRTGAGGEAGGFLGFLAQVGVAARNVGQWIATSLVPAVQQLAAGFSSGQFAVLMGQIGAGIRIVAPMIRDLATKALPVLKQIFTQAGEGIRSAILNITTAIQANKPELLALVAGYRSFADFMITRVYPVLGPVLRAVFAGIGFSIRTSINTIGFLIRAAQTLAVVIAATVARIRAVWQAFWGGPFGALARAGFSLLVAVVRVGIASVLASVRTVAAVVGIISAPFRAAVSAAASAIGSLIRVTAGIRGRIVSALGNLGSLLYNAGRAVVQGLINGITSRISGLASAASKLADTIARVLPGSPVREGPLTVLNRGRAGGLIATMLADGIVSRASAVSAAMRDATSLPALAGIPGGAGGGGTVRLHPDEGGSLAAALRDALAGMSWQVQLDPSGVATLVARGNRQLGRRG